MSDTGRELPGGFCPPEVISLISRLEDAGYEAYVVGGSLRDGVMGRPVHDFDVASSATPDDVASLFSDCRVISTGARHGTQTVIVGALPVEVTTFRVDGGYSDGRHPDGVRFTSSVAEDLARRDFTVNAMAYSPRTGLIDLMGGKKDIERRLIRSVGDPAKRFGEDALRILRAFRFAARLGFDIDRDTLAAAISLRERLSLISEERIASELMGILTSPFPSRVAGLMLDGGIFGIILPDTVLTHKDTDALDASPARASVRFGTLLRGREREKVAGALRRLKYPNAHIRASAAAASEQLPPDAGEESVRIFLRRTGERADDVIAAAAARGEHTQSGEDTSCVQHTLALIRGRGDPICLSDLAIDGGDLADVGIGGRSAGRVLLALLDDVTAAPEHNTREYLTALALTLAAENL